MAPMFQGFPVHAGSVRSLVQRPERSGGGGGGGGGDLREARQSLYGLHRPQRSFVRCFLISVFNLAPLPPPPPPLLRLRLPPPRPTTAPHPPLSPDLMERNENADGEKASEPTRIEF